MTRTSTATAICLTLLASVLLAQAKPNFAGKWSAVDGNGGGQGGMFAATEMTVTQDDKILTVTQTGQMGEIKTTYNLDGSPAKNTLDFNGTSVERVTKSTWDGAKLGLTTSSSFNGQSFETKAVWSLNGDGTLLVETTRPDFQGGGAPITSKTTYKK